MNNDERDIESETTTNAPPTDTSGKPVNVVQRDLQDRDSEVEGFDEAVTPSSPPTKEQDAEELQRKIDKIERKVADGH